MTAASLNGFVQQLHYALRLSVVRIRQDVKNYTLGFAWWFLDPVIDTVILFVVTTMILNVRTEDMAVFLLTGLLVFRYLQSTISGSCASLSPALNLSSRLYVPKHVFVVRDLMAQTFKFVLGIAVLLLLLALLGIGEVSVVETVFVFFVAFVFVTGMASIFSIASAALADVRVVLGYAFRLLFFVSGLFFTLDDVPERFRDLFLLNPFALLVHEFRLAMLTPAPLDYDKLLVLLVVSLLSALIGFRLLVRFDRTLPKYVI
ncbi:MAG: ABC transporter permease [Gammaproteobacteria bacterium]